ncbi:hypothetical protein FSP39_006781 [Pinctada imbricata]|uniref:Transglutaminase-like domain-containing protein n=1 Tax=Pinctada imbricata TaxID=66713 RepID=A0AA88XWR3_PINIB|nr:hypothetical protein FSP39_006781 [Pinctada imbricata]
MGCGSSTTIVNNPDIKKDLAAEPSDIKKVSSDRLSGNAAAREKNIGKDERRNKNSHERENNLHKTKGKEEKVEARKDDIGKTKDEKKKHTSENQNSNGNNFVFDFTRIDAHALKAPDEVCDSTRDLAEYLMKGSTDQLNRARSFYRWITENIRYDTESFFGTNKQPVDAESVLRLGTAVCAGYANLFEELCKHGGIKVKVISGYAKGYGYDPDSPISFKNQTNHAWNAINIDNKWRFVECTWGAGYLDNQRIFQKSFDEFYFLTDPKYFINDHFPFMDDDKESSKKWQLLEQPFTIEEYSAIAKLSNHAMKWGLKFSHNEGVIEVGKTFELEIEDTRGILIDSKMHLTHSDGQECDEYMFFRRVERRIYKVTIKLPTSGKFKLQVFGKVDSLKEKLDNLVTYLLKCKSVDSNVQRYPKHSGLWGVDSKAYNIGFKPSIASKVLFKALNGKLSLELPADSVPSSILQLTGTSSEDLKRFSLLETRNSGLQIHLRLPGQGFYKLEVMCQIDNSSLYYSVMSFLIENFPNTDEEATSFPETFRHTQEYQCELIQPTTGVLLADTPAQVRFKSPKMVRGFVKSGTNHADLRKDGEVWEAEVTAASTGGVLSVNGNITGENKGYTLYRFNIV